MKINKSPKNNKKIIYIVLAIFLSVVILSVIGFYYLQNRQKNADMQQGQNIDYNPPTEDQKQAGEDIKKANQTTISTTFSALITATNVSNDIVQIRTIINGIVSNDGVCELSLTKNDEVIIRTTNIYALPSSSTCQGFDINRSELSAGTWSILLTVTINNEITTASGEVVLE